MIPISIKACVRTIMIIFTISLVNGEDRKITPMLNPDCLTCTGRNTLVYIKAEGSNDTIHQIWDFTLGTPTVMFAVASRYSTINISWKNSVPINIALNDTPIYSFAAIIDKLVEYDDVEDKGHIDDDCPREEYDMWDLMWQLRDSILTSEEAMVSVHGHFRHKKRSGIVDFKLDMVPFRDYATELPHLIHTANSSLVDVRLVNVSTSRGFNSSRLALRLVLLSSDPGALHCSLRKSLDDEHTPGVFEIIEIKSPRAFAGGDGAFVQFRPVAYTEPERSVSSSTNAYITNFVNSTLLLDKTTLGAFYRSHDSSYMLIESAYVSFGMPGDGFYAQHNYTAWSFTLGYGQPPVESFSMFVIIIIAAGLAVPLLLALSAIGYVVVRRCRQRQQPQRLYDEE